MRKGRDGEKRKKTTSLPAVDRTNADRWNAARSRQNQYIGEFSRTLQSRFSEHLGYVKSKNISKATGDHFTSRGHQQSDMEVTIVEKEERRCAYRS